VSLSDLGGANLSGRNHAIRGQSGTRKPGLEPCSNRSICADFALLFIMDLTMHPDVVCKMARRDGSNKRDCYSDAAQSGIGVFGKQQPAFRRSVGQAQRLQRHTRRNKEDAQRHTREKRGTKRMSHDPLLPTPYQMFALLIDADNTSVDLFPQMMHYIEVWGTMTIRRVYGNQETLLSHKWKELCLRYALQPMLHLGRPGAKNATDIALTVDAMDLLWLCNESMLSFCLLTGGQDVTALVLRLRNQGCHVYYIGKLSKAEALAKACITFLSIEQLEPAGTPAKKIAIPAQAQATSHKKTQAWATLS
jgi:hypothetical protein